MGRSPGFALPSLASVAPPHPTASPSGSPATLHFDLFSGVSGDMLLASLLNCNPGLLGPLRGMLERMTSINGEWTLNYGEVLKGDGGINAGRVKVQSIWGNVIHVPYLLLHQPLSNYNRPKKHAIFCFLFHF